jgi:hypothetical protein
MSPFTNRIHGESRDVLSRPENLFVNEPPQTQRKDAVNYLSVFAVFFLFFLAMGSIADHALGQQQEVVQEIQYTPDEIFFNPLSGRKDYYVPEND